MNNRGYTQFIAYTAAESGCMDGKSRVVHYNKGEEKK